jgi:NADPH:quinone reductase-like Zn-dependent oxidoreductase
MGMLVETFPFTPGCDIGGVVIKVGAKALSPRGVPYKVGDHVCGCSGVGRPLFGTFQEQVRSSSQERYSISLDLTLL